MRRLAGLLAIAWALPAAAQESGWRYSPYPGEGDRAALGCSYGSTPAEHVCLAVRCEDDFSVGLHLDTTRPGGDAGPWTIQVDRSSYEVTAATVEGSPYGAKVEGDIAPILDEIRNGDSLFIDPRGGSAPPNRGIGLAGSLRAITQALYFCAPRVVPEATEEADND